MKIALLIPCYNEAAVLPLFWQECQKALSSLSDTQFDYIFINDGSKDDTLGWLKELASKNSQVKIISLSRNFGKEAALTAGLKEGENYDAVVVIDADLQDPPALIVDFIRYFKEGFDIVYGQRGNRASDTFFKRTTATLFYKIYNLLSTYPMPANAGDFRLLSRRAVQAVLALPERERFMKGIFNWIGYKTKAVPFTRTPRAAGNTAWNYWKLWNFSLQGLTSCSTGLLRLWTYMGIVIACLAGLYAIFIAYKKIMFGNPVSGYTSLMVAILFFSGVQLISLGIIGEYLGRIFMETKQRPLYLIDEKINCK